MTGTKIDGKAIAQTVKDRVKKSTSELKTSTSLFNEFLFTSPFIALSKPLILFSNPSFL